MNPVVGLDVAKGESQVQMFLDKKMPYKSIVKIEHTIEAEKESRFQAFFFCSLISNIYFTCP
ncbi:hypothetical protein ACOMCU_27420 [Lysinibacillus sp. UGB7]|uniref:hypothetical protein n=1 Tax=Lysinibacillus sp. UGB7 TaxID=3411039 RepID=UPI003B80340B